eukprot:scaffold23933_cov119-Isochrysis_galbana.AAC.6
MSTPPSPMSMAHLTYLFVVLPCLGSFPHSLHMKMKADRCLSVPPTPRGCLLRGLLHVFPESCVGTGYAHALRRPISRTGPDPPIPRSLTHGRWVGVKFAHSYPIRPRRMAHHRWGGPSIMVSYRPGVTIAT